MDRAAVLTAFNEQIRRGTAEDGTGARFETTELLVRRLAPPGQYGSGVFWTDLDAGNADAVIAAEIALFRDRGERFEWKLYDYDRPADLAGRLSAAGLAAEEPEAFVVAEVGAVIEALGPAEPPPGVTISQVTDRAGVELMSAVSEQVFGERQPELLESLVTQLAAAPEMTGLFLATAGDVPVSGSRIEFLPDTEFAGLWGGGTLPQWRRRGIYRAMVRRRAELAAQRGYKYVFVDASDQSRPILERLGFTCLAITTPYIYDPAA